MNYYERYCGDYARKTAGLSLQEHGAYTLMLDNYYAEETPLPASYDDLYRICRAMKAPERDAVRKVADKFFPIGEDGLRHNEKADEVIAKAKKRIAAAKANGSRNSYPPGRPPGNPVGMPVGSPPGGPVAHIGTSTRPQTPYTKSQIPVGSAPDGARHADALIQFPLQDGSEFPIDRALLAELEPLYPAVDVPQTCREMCGWLIGNPTRRKTRRGVKKFITSWLQREQEKHGS